MARERRPRGSTSDTSKGGDSSAYEKTAKAASLVGAALAAIRSRNPFATAERGAKQASAEMDRLRKAIEKDEAAFKAMKDGMKGMKGATVDVTGAKRRLKEQMTAAQSAIKGNKTELANATAKYIQCGGAADKLSAKQSKAGATGAQAGAGIGKGGSAASSAGQAYLEAAKQVSKVVAVLAAAYTALAVFALKSFDAARSLKITATAFTGSAQNAEALGAHVRQLERQLPQTRNELNELAESLADSGLQGNNLVSALKAVATAGAVRPKAAQALKSIAEAAVQTKRVMIGVFDLKGTGLTLDDVAGELAPKIKTSLAEARNALLQGRVGIKSGIEALEAVATKKFGKLAAQQALSLPSQLEKLSTAIGDLFSKIDFEPVLQMLKDFVDLLDTSTSTGRGLAGLFRGMFGGLGASARGAKPIMKGFLEGLIVGGLQLAIIFYKVRNSLRRLIPEELKPNIDAVTAAWWAGKVAMAVFGAGIIMVAAAVVVLLAPFILLAAIVGLAIYAVKRFGPAVRDGIVRAVNWIREKVGAAISFIGELPGKLLALGKEMMEKLAEGITAAAGLVSDAAVGVADGILGTLAPAVPVPNGPGGGKPPLKGEGGRIPLGPAIGGFGKASYIPDVPMQRETVASNTTNSTTNNGQRHTHFHGVGEADRGWIKREFYSALRGEANGAGIPV